MPIAAHRGLSGLLTRFGLAAVVAAAAGALTEWSVPHLPWTLAPLANSAAPWLVVAFGLALLAQRVGESVALATAVLVALVLGFYVAQDLRGWAVDRHQVEFWCLGSLVFGPLVGLAAAWLKRARVSLGAVGAGVMAGLLAGEAVHGLTQLRLYTPHGYWHVQLGVAAGFFLLGVLWSSRRRPLALLLALAVATVSCAAVGFFTLAAYQTP